jgi:hypothetical protein
MPTAQRLHLSSAEYDVLWSHLELGRMPYPVSVPSSGFETAERDRVVTGAWDALASRGLARGRAVDEDVADLLRLLARPAYSIDAVADGGGGSLRALSAGDGRRAVTALLADGGLLLTEVRPTEMTFSLAEMLPQAGPGPGRAFTFPYHALQAATAEQDDLGDDDDPFREEDDERDALVRAGLNQGDAMALAELAEKRFRGGQFGITTWRGPGTGRTRFPTLVTWFDTRGGRYLVVREQDWVSVTPADADRIAARIDQVLAAARQ